MLVFSEANIRNIAPRLLGMRYFLAILKWIEFSST